MACDHPVHLWGERGPGHPCAQELPLQYETKQYETKRYETKRHLSY